jgi:predicted dehydrogenase
MATSGELAVAVVGAGAMGSLHCRVVAQNPGTTLACIVDPREDAGRHMAAQFGTRWLPDLDSFALVDAVIVATPTEIHEPWVERVLAAGKPVLVEKPMSLDLAEAEQMVKEAEQRDLPIMCGFVERWNPAVMLALQITDAPVHFQAIRHSPYAPRIRTGVSGDLLIHDVDLAIRFAGADPIAASASMRTFDPRSDQQAEDIADAHLTFPNGMMATASASRIAHRKVRSIAINELDRTLELDLLRQDVTVYRHIDNALLEDSGGYRQQTVIDIPVMPLRKEPLQSQLDHFVALARGESDHDTERASLLAPHRVLSLLRQ